MARHTIIVCGPKGCGKTQNADVIKRYLGLTHVIDQWRPKGLIPPYDCLILTNCEIVGSVYKGVAVRQYDDIMAMVQLQGPSK